VVVVTTAAAHRVGGVMIFRIPRQGEAMPKKIKPQDLSPDLRKIHDEAAAKRGAAAADAAVQRVNSYSGIIENADLAKAVAETADQAVNAQYRRSETASQPEQPKRRGFGRR
jgi:hypothetical protein